MTSASELGEFIKSHQGVAFVTDEANDRDWYRCSCGGTYGGRQWPPRNGRRERFPERFGPTKDEHVADAVLSFLSHKAE